MQNIVFYLNTVVFFYYCFNYFITVLAFTIYKLYSVAQQKTKNIVISQIFVDEFNKRTDDTKR